MPSIQDVADQINARLNQIVTHTQNTAQNTADILAVENQIRGELQQANARLGQIDNTLANGFANLSQGLFAILQVQIAALGLLDHNREQNDTIICELVNNNDLLCDIKRKAGRLVALGETAVTTQKRIEGIVERVHCCEAADYDRGLEMAARIERCCPPEEPEPEPCPERCRVPDFRPRQPAGQDWKPLPTPERPDPIG